MSKFNFRLVLVEGILEVEGKVKVYETHPSAQLYVVPMFRRMSSHLARKEFEKKCEFQKLCATF